jgi:hypothetical protein
MKEVRKCMHSETWSLILRQEHKFGVSENRVQRLFESKRQEVGEAEENYIMRNFMICNS